MLWFIYLAKLRTDLLDNRSLAILLETYKLLICYTLVFGQPLSRGHLQSFISILVNPIALEVAVAWSIEICSGSLTLGFLGGLEKIMALGFEKP
jgi:hypothetical protein